MLNRYSDQLRSGDSEVRKAAIKALAREVHDEPEIVLKLLAAIYKQDPDPEVRYVALQAGRYIQKFIPEKITMPERSKLDDFRSANDGSAAAAIVPNAAPAEITRKQREQAETLKKQAFDANMRGETKKAIQLLRRAFLTNPNLQTNGHAASLASTFTGIKDTPAAVAAVLGNSVQVTNTQSYFNERRIRALRGHKEEGTWMDALIWLVSLTGAIGLGPVLIVLVFAQVIFGLSTRGGSADLTVATNAIIPIVLLIAGFAVGYLFVQLCFTHVFARAVFKGQGTLPNLVYRIARFQTLFLIGYIVSIVLLIFALLFLVFFAPMLVAGIVELLGITAPLLQFGVGLGLFLWTLNIVADVYHPNFGFFKALGSVLLGAVVAVAILWAFFALLGLIAGDLLASLIRLN